ncbi:hypothetical protein ACFWSF_29730 [Streptomyces sp. NPDC058611]|uniref:hypothetical protein n=1 Tax=unclassified Streptomyces TaxID=2593676 RepID=UPI003646D6F7
MDAEEVTDFGGTATVGIAHPAAAGHEQQLVKAMTEGRAAEYQQILVDRALGSVAVGRGEVVAALDAPQLGAELAECALPFACVAGGFGLGQLRGR